MKMRKTQSFKRRCVFSYLSGSKKMCIPCLFFCFSKYQGFTAQTIECEFVRKRKLKASRNDQSISMVEKASAPSLFFFWWLPNCAKCLKMAVLLFKKNF
ncbi:hypothetical protein ERO13_D11G078301v2 [Gossypium hirsutum]|nr:hypothetical protein ERO13_D11G078301v2 [Gossypium hirsutum]